MALTVSLTGCSLFREEAGPPPAADISSAALKSFRMEGRLGVQTAADAWQANLFWNHGPEQDQLRISGPLSQGMVSIVLRKDLIYINEGHGVTALSHEPDALLRERLGFAVPLASLRYWILGLPDPNFRYTAIPGGAKASGGFLQSGWTVMLDRLMTVGDRRLPQKLRVQGAGVKLKIVADQWETE